MLAGDRALGLDTASALTFFERALALTPEGHPRRTDVLMRFGQAALDAGRPADSARAFEEAIDIFRSRGDLTSAGGAMLPLVQVMSSLGDPRTFQIGADALAILDPLPTGPELVGALVEVARAEVLGGEARLGVRDADRAIRLAEEIGMPTPARAIGYRGLGRCQLGEAGGLDDLRQALDLAIEQGQSREAATLYNNLGRTIWPIEGPDVALRIYRQGIAFDRARGIASMAVWCEGSSLDVLVDTGKIDEAMAAAQRVANESKALGTLPPLITARSILARVHVMRGDVRETPEELDWLESAARGTKSPEIIVQAGAAAFAWASLGRADRATPILSDIAGASAVGTQGTYAAWLPSFVRAALSMDERELAERLGSALRQTSSYAEHAEVMVAATLAEADDDLEGAAAAYADAAARWEAFGVVPEYGFALLGQGRCLLATSRSAEAFKALADSREIFVRLGAAGELRDVGELLQDDAGAERR